MALHFTHVDNLESIVTGGLCCDSAAQDGRLRREVGYTDIKARRRERTVPVGVGGVVADYVPFYFAARSPMLYVITKGQVPTYRDGQSDLVYLITSAERVVDATLAFVFTDRNAALAHAKFETDPARLDATIDWPLMEQAMWNDTPQAPDRKERRMAEFLVQPKRPVGGGAGRRCDRRGASCDS